MNSEIRMPAPATPPPDDAALAARLGSKKKIWDAALARLQEAHPGLRPEWKLYGKSGWWLKMLKGTRNLLFLIPVDGGCDAVFIYGAKAVEAARVAGLPPAVWQKIEEARPYAEGRGFRIPLATKKDLDILMQLAAIKVEN